MGCQARYYIPIAGILAVIAAFGLILAFDMYFKHFDENLYEDNKLPFKSNIVRIVEKPSNSGVALELLRGNTEVLVSQISNLGENIEIYNFGESFNIYGSETYLTFKHRAVGNDFYLYEVKQFVTKNCEKVVHCFNLHIEKWTWFGGPSQQRQYWPIERLVFHEDEFAPNHQKRINVADLYWLNSAGSFIYFKKYVSLTVKQNTGRNSLCVNINKNQDSPLMPLEYIIGVARNAKHAHEYAIQHYLREKPWTPNSNTVNFPIWSTSARFGKDVNETMILQYAKEIKLHSFEGGQISIDDRWEDCYGTLSFDKQKFPNIKSTIRSLKKLGFRVSVWIHPFVNKQCDKLHAIGLTKNLFLANINGDVDTTWWNSEENGASHIDVSGKKGNDWFCDRLEMLRSTYGIDGFKFDAGEYDLIPKLGHSKQYVTEAYINIAAKFANQSSIGVGFHSQSKTTYLRMAQLNSTWSWDNGLPNLVTKLLHLGMLGYEYIVPDVVGGHDMNGTRFDKELYIRWMQAVAFIQVVHFSYAPWDIDKQTADIWRDLSLLRGIYNISNTVFNNDAPKVAPIWWLDPEDRTAQQINDEYLVDGKILSAPVLQQGQTSRNIYLPQGLWHDARSNSYIEGPKWLADYPAPLDVLPYFIKDHVVDY